jgi:hypothetical protein
MNIRSFSPGSRWQAGSVVAAAALAVGAALLRRHTLLFYTPEGHAAGIAVKREASWLASTPYLRGETPWLWAPESGLLLRSYRALTTLRLDAPPLLPALCEARPAPTLGGCARWEGEDAGPGDGPIEHRGTIVAVNVGEWACDPAHGLDIPAARWPDGVTLHVKNDNGTVRVSVVMPWRVHPFTLGSVVEVRQREQTSGFAYREHTLTVLAANGSPLFWLGQSNAASGLALPNELSLQVGDAACGDGNTCGTWTGRDLLLTNGDARTRLPYKGVAQIGPYAFVSTHAEVPDPHSGEGCADWTIGRVVLGAMRGELPELERRANGPCADGACARGELCSVPREAACATDASSARCVPLPEHCDLGCPGVCGCDGRFYCNPCLAQQRGRTAVAPSESCAEAPCPAGFSGSVDEDGVWGSIGLSCHGQSFYVACASTAPSAACACIDDGVEVARIERGERAGPELLRACGFPVPGGPR